MKRAELIRQLTREGCVLQQPVPRHSEIDDALAKHIRKYLGLST